MTRSSGVGETVATSGQTAEVAIVHQSSDSTANGGFRGMGMALPNRLRQVTRQDGVVRAAVLELFDQVQDLGSVFPGQRFHAALDTLRQRLLTDNGVVLLGGAS